MRISQKGQTLVEFALVLPLLFLLLFGIVDLGIMFYVNLTMQYAVYQGTRYAVTGQSDLGTDRRSALIAKIKNSSFGLYDKNTHTPKDPEISVITPSKVTFTNYTGTPTTGNPGKPNDIIIVSLTYTWPLLTPMLKPFFPGGNYTFTVKATMKNETFPPS
jgi:Flp pilus assembly protein TadG